MSKIYYNWIESKIRNKFHGMHNRAKRSGDRISVCSHWTPSQNPKAYQDFKQWMLSQRWRGDRGEIFELDKDKYSHDDYFKIYSPETFCFITKHENVLLSGWLDERTTLV